MHLINYLSTLFVKLKSKIFNRYPVLSDSNYDWLIVGLGNPGSRYENTRHNIGWMVLDYIGQKFQKEFIHRLYFDTLDMYLHEQHIGLIKPNVFMNNSGEPVLRFSQRYNIPPEKIVVIHDEYNFPVGKIHLKLGGSDGGHNGVASIQEKLDTLNFLRLRCGIGNDFGPGELVSYVLSEFEEREKPFLADMVQHAAESVEFLISNDINYSMNKINSEELWGVSINPGAAIVSA